MSRAATEIIYGMHAVESTLRNDPVNVLQLLVEKGRQDRRIQQLVELAKQQGIALEPMRKAELDKLCQQQRHQGVALRYKAEAAGPAYSLNDILARDQVLILVLDGVQDPHNLGACLRTADAAGVDAVIVPKDRAVGITPVVRKVACGAAETVAFFQVTNLARTLEQLQQANVWIVGTAGEATQAIYDQDLTGRIALVMGAEEKGMRRLTREKCDHLVKLPMAGQVESLNVSVATGICLFEAVRQRRSV